MVFAKKRIFVIRYVIYGIRAKKYWSHVLECLHCPSYDTHTGIDTSAFSVFLVLRFFTSIILCAVSQFCALPHSFAFFLNIRAIFLFV